MTTGTIARTLLFTGMALLLAPVEPASARGRFGFSLGGPMGVHVNTNGRVSVSTPTPQANVGFGGGTYGVSTTVDPRGIRTNVSAPYGVSGGASSDGDVYGGVYQDFPGGSSVSGHVDPDGVSGDVMFDPIPERDYGP